MGILYSLPITSKFSGEVSEKILVSINPFLPEVAMRVMLQVSPHELSWGGGRIKLMIGYCDSFSALNVNPV